MSRKHFIAIAKAISELANEDERRRMADVLAPVFRAENPAFDVARFYAACKIAR